MDSCMESIQHNKTVRMSIINSRRKEEMFRRKPQHRNIMIVEWFIYYELVAIISVQLIQGLEAAPSLSVRLDAGDKECDLYPNSNGRLEVFHNGEWGTVCNHGWGEKESTVACRMLGFKYGNLVPPNFYDPGEGAIWMNNVNCTGDEDSLLDCQHADWGQNTCFHEEDVNIWCNNYTVHGTFKLSTSATGKVGFSCTTEVFTDVHYSWINDCHRVGNQRKIEFDLTKESHSTMWICDRVVKSTEKDLFRYYVYINAPYDVRLVGDEKVDDGGRVELFYDGKWGTVCDRLWNSRDSDEICKSLGFKQGEQVNITEFGEGTGLVWSPTMNCIADGPGTMERCLFNRSDSGCKHENDVAVKCSGCGETKWIKIEGLTPRNDPIYGLPGDFIRLKCRRSKCGNDSQIEWIQTASGFKDEHFQNDGDGINTLTSYINFTFSLSKPVVEIECRQGWRVSRPQKFLTLFGPESVVMASEEINGTSTIKVNCTTTNSIGKLKFSWFVNDEDVSDSAVLKALKEGAFEGKPRTSEFVFYPPNKQPDETVIKCVVTNPGIRTVEAERKWAELVSRGNNVVYLSKWFLCFISFLVVLVNKNE